MKREEQLIPRLRAYFRQNPAEALTFDDVAARFDCDRRQAQRACEKLRNEGFVVTRIVAMLNPERTRA